jgi:hypothetical protein
MKHHVVFCYNNHGAHVASCTIDTGAEDFAPGTERWLTAIKGKARAEVNCAVCIVSWQELVEDVPATEGDFPGNYGPEVVQREKTFEEKRDEGAARGLAEHARRKAAIEASRHRCGDCGHFPPACTEHVAAICTRAGVLVTDTTRTLCRHFSEKELFVDKHNCADCDHMPKWATAIAPEFCKAMGVLVGDSTWVSCPKFVMKGTLAPEQRCGDCLYLHPGGCNLLDRHVNANTIGRCGKFAAKVTP